MKTRSIYGLLLVLVTISLSFRSTNTHASEPPPLGLRCTVSAVEIYGYGNYSIIMGDLVPSMPDPPGSYNFRVDANCGSTRNTIILVSASDETRIKLLYSQVVAALLSGKAVAFVDVGIQPYPDTYTAVRLRLESE